MAVAGWRLMNDKSSSHDLWQPKCSNPRSNKQKKVWTSIKLKKKTFKLSILKVPYCSFRNLPRWRRLGQDRWMTSLHHAIFERAARLFVSLLQVIFWNLWYNFRNKFWDNFGGGNNFQLRKCNSKTSEVYHDGGGWVKIDEWRVFITRSLSQASSKKCSFIILEGNLCCLTEIEIVTSTSISYYFKNESNNYYT